MTKPRGNPDKVPWSGRIVAVQPRIRLMRSFNERSHSYLGYVLRIDGICGGDAGKFLIAVGKGAHDKHRFHAGMAVQGLAVPVDDQRKEAAAFYKTSGISVLGNNEDKTTAAPPAHGVPPELEIYRGRGHRRLDPRTYDAKCMSCIWGCRMAVEVIIDHWNPSERQYRFETFCYGPKSCPCYKAGTARRVPGRRGMFYIEEDWVDEDATAHRGPDD